jgi:ABC-type branched-subunit amino acid transport system substrate-binding protein
MSSRVLARRRAACAWALLALVVSGCTSSGSGSSAVTVSGKTLTIYLSNASTSQPLVARDVLAAEQLAFKQGPSSVGGFTLQTKVVSGKISDEARTAIQDQSAIAYLGEIVPHSSYASVGITNAADLLQVSPTDNALELTQATPVVPGAPDKYYESLSAYGQTFARVVPTSALEAKALVQEMRTLGVRKLYVADDGGPYGAAIANVVKHDAGGTVSVVGSLNGADAAFYGTSSPSSALRFFQRASSSNQQVKLFGPSALADPTIASRLSALGHLYVSAPGFLKSDLTPSGSTFVSQFTSTYGHAPVPQAIFGYEAMSAVLAVLKEAGAKANNRSTVVHDFLSIKNRQSVLGTYSIDSSGDTSIAPFVISRVQQGKLVPFVQVQG